MEYNVSLPLSLDFVKGLNIGDRLYLSGVIYTARDAAHLRLVEAIKKGEELPFDLKEAFIYYVGPTPERDSRPIGSAGPTTSTRMDLYSPTLLDLGLRGMIGKGFRNSTVKASIVKNQALYLGAIGGAGAYLSKCILESKLIAYEDLGPEGIRRLVVKDFPVVVLIDTKGRDLYSV